MDKFFCDECKITHDPEELITITMPYNQVMGLLVFATMALNMNTRMSNFADKITTMVAWSNLEEHCVPDVMTGLVSMVQALPSSMAGHKSILDTIRDEARRVKEFYQ